MLTRSYTSSSDVDAASTDLEDEEKQKESEGACGYDSSNDGHVVLLNFILCKTIWLCTLTLDPSPLPVDPRQLTVEGDHACLSFLQPRQLTVDGKRARLSFLHQQVNLHGIEAFVLH